MRFAKHGHVPGIDNKWTRITFHRIRRDETPYSHCKPPILAFYKGNMEDGTELMHHAFIIWLTYRWSYHQWTALLIVSYTSLIAINVWICNAVYWMDHDVKKMCEQSSIINSWKVRRTDKLLYESNTNLYFSQSNLLTTSTSPQGSASSSPMGALFLLLADRCFFAMRNIDTKNIQKIYFNSSWPCWLVLLRSEIYHVLLNIE